VTKSKPHFQYFRQKKASGLRKAGGEAEIQWAFFGRRQLEGNCK